MAREKGEVPRQQPIPVTAGERRVLEQLRREYEEAIGLTVDWGDFLVSTCSVGVAKINDRLIARR